MVLRQTRRRFLTGGVSLAMGLSGCLDGSTSGGEITGDQTSSTADHASTTEPTTTVPFSAYSFDWSAEIVRQATRTNAPKLRLELTNAGSRTAELGFGPTPPFSGPLAESADGGNRLLLYHPDMGPHSAPETRTEECWQLEGDPMVAVNSILTVRRLDPGESLNETYTLYNMPENDSCFPGGSYTFRSAAFLPASSARELLLGITVRVADSRVTSTTAEPPSVTSG